MKIADLIEGKKLKTSNCSTAQSLKNQFGDNWEIKRMKVKGTENLWICVYCNDKWNAHLPINNDSFPIIKTRFILL
jgi:hypothetical protein